MKVTPIAHTVIDPYKLGEETSYSPHDGPEWDSIPTDADELSEFAGRACYTAWERKRPETATNGGYLRNILNQGHYSVLEHSSVSFYVEGVSRSLLTEISRHRHLSFSVVSQRYVRMEQENVVVPPAIKEHGNVVIHNGGTFHTNWSIRDEFDGAVEAAFVSYQLIADKLLEQGLPKKKAMEAARSVLPNCVDSPMVITGNLRAWRDVLGKRYHVAADAEIQEFAKELLKQLLEIAPSSFQDFPDEPFGDS